MAGRRHHTRLDVPLGADFRQCRVGMELFPVVLLRVHLIRHHWLWHDFILMPDKSHFYTLTGDVTPGETRDTLYLFILIFIGLSLVSMTINVIQVSRRERKRGFRRFSDKTGTPLREPHDGDDDAVQ